MQNNLKTLTRSEALCYGWIKIAVLSAYLFGLMMFFCFFSIHVLKTFDLRFYDEIYKCCLWYVMSDWAVKSDCQAWFSSYWQTVTCKVMQKTTLICRVQGSTVMGKLSHSIGLAFLKIAALTRDLTASFCCSKLCCKHLEWWVVLLKKENPQDLSNPLFIKVRRQVVEMAFSSNALMFWPTGHNKILKHIFLKGIVCLMIFFILIMNGAENEEVLLPLISVLIKRRGRFSVKLLV